MRPESYTPTLKRFKSPWLYAVVVKRPPESTHAKPAAWPYPSNEEMRVRCQKYGCINTSIKNCSRNYSPTEPEGEHRIVCVSSGSKEKPKALRSTSGHLFHFYYYCKSYKFCKPFCMNGTRPQSPSTHSLHLQNFNKYAIYTKTGSNCQAGYRFAALKLMWGAYEKKQEDLTINLKSNAAAKLYHINKKLQSN